MNFAKLLNYYFWSAVAHSSDCTLFDVEFPLMVELVVSWPLICI